MLVVFFIMLGGVVLLYFITKSKYEDFIEPAGYKEFPLKKLFPVALYLLDLINYKYSYKYDNMLAGKLAEIHGSKYSQYYLRIHWANKLCLVLLSLLFTAFLGVCAGYDISVGIFGLILMCAAFFLPDRELNEKVKKRHTSIQLDFPDFINKLILLVNAGMTVSRAWEKIVQDNKVDKPLNRELESALADIKAGKSEIQAYEAFAKRCRIPQVTKFVSVVIQNLKKGNSELIPILRLQASDCWEMRKNTAKRLGEEASTKMLIPMMIMFIAILIIVAVPAILAMGSI